MRSLEAMSETEAKELLKTLFKEVGVVSSWKWDDALRNVKEEGRYKMLKMSMHDKKTVFNEYMHEQRQREKDES